MIYDERNDDISSLHKTLTEAKETITKHKQAIQREVQAAHGNPKERRTQSAREFLENAGYDWRTGKKTKKRFKWLK